MNATMVDNTYRWAIVLFLAVALVAVLLPVSYRKGFPRRLALQQIGGAAILFSIGLVIAGALKESLVDAMLLRAIFGFIVPDTGVHGYGWFLVFGYAIGLANLVVFAIGVVMTRLRRLPPWIVDNQNRDRKG